MHGHSFQKSTVFKFNKYLEKKRISTNFTHREPPVFHSLFYIYNYIKSKFCIIQGRSFEQLYDFYTDESADAQPKPLYRTRLL